MAYENQRLLPQHHTMIEYALQGLGVKEIAQTMGYSPQGVGSVMACAIFQDELARKRAKLEKVQHQVVASTVVQARDRLHGAAVTAADKLITLVQSKNENVAMKAIDSILNRVEGLVVPPQVVQPQLVSQDRLQLFIITMNERGLDPKRFVSSQPVPEQSAV